MLAPALFQSGEHLLKKGQRLQEALEMREALKLSSFYRPL
jgi:hypothetical protein